MKSSDDRDRHGRDRKGGSDAESPLSCREVRDLLVPWLDGELSPEDSPRVSGHVAACSVCQRELELHRSVASTLDDLYATRSPVDRDITLQVRRRLRRERRTTRRVALGIAASVLLALGWWWLGSSPGGSSGGGEDFIAAAAEQELIENLDVLEAFDEAGIELTPELVQTLLDEDSAFGDDELDEIFEYVLEEEVLSDQL